MLNIIFFWISLFIVIYIFTRDGKTERSRKVENIPEGEENSLRILKRKEFENFFGDKLNPEEKERLYEVFQRRCFKCGSREALSFDHHLPISKGYPLKDKEAGLNAVVLCEKCNREKGDILPESYYTKEELKKLENLGVRSHLYYSSKRLKLLDKRLLSGKINFLEKCRENKDKVKFVYLDMRDPLFVSEKVEVVPLRIVGRKTFLYRGYTREWFLYSVGDKSRTFNIRWIYNLEKYYI